MRLQWNFTIAGQYKCLFLSPKDMCIEWMHVFVLFITAFIGYSKRLWV